MIKKKQQQPFIFGLVSDSKHLISHYNTAAYTKTKITQIKELVSLY